MNGNHKSWELTYVLSPTSPLTSGGSKDLGDGQIGLFKDKAGARGAIATDSLLNTKNEKYFLQVGTNIKTNQAGRTSKAMRTVHFLPKDVTELSFSEAKDPTLAQVYLGYDGLDTSKSLTLGAGESATIHLKLIGAPLAYFGFKGGIYEGTFTIAADELDACEGDCDDEDLGQKVLKLVEIMKKRQLRQGVLLQDIIDIHPISSVSFNADATGTTKFYTLQVKDLGDDQSQGLVQAQATGYDVTRIKREGIFSTYQAVGSSAPDDFVEWNASLKTDCEGDCPEGYTEVAGGYLYNISVATAAGLEAALEAKAYITSATKVGQEHNLDKYALICPAELTVSNLSNLTTSFPTIEVDAEFTIVDSVCTKDDNAEFAWVEDKTCNVSEDLYYIELDDNDCGESRLADLQTAFPDRDIFILGEVTTVTTPVSGTFTDGTYTAVSGTTNGRGTGATFNVVITGGNSAAITVVSKGDNYEAGDTITISDEDLGDEGEDDLVITIATITNTVKGTCRQRYYTTVITNAVCDECHPDMYVSEAPQPFEYELWNKVANPVLTGGAYGIMFRSKKNQLCPPKELADTIGAFNNIVEIEVSGGALEGTMIGYNYNEAGEFKKTRRSRAFDGTGWGKNYWYDELCSYEYFLGDSISNNTEERWFKNALSKLEPCMQYDAVTLGVKREFFAQGFNAKTEENFRVNFIIPKGSKDLYTDFFNSVAAGNLDAGSI
jgi:hypothetical protein